MINIDHSRQYTWHPCSQMKDYETFPPLHITKARGSYLFADGDKPIIDAISSWWCKSLGHGHPRLKKALTQQLERFEHVILANTTNNTITLLSQLLAKLTQNRLDKVFYASDGSCAVEIAMKMSLHAHHIQGQLQRTRFIALENGYHGETLGALSVSDLGLYRKPYNDILCDAIFIHSIPYVNSKKDSLWNDCSHLWPEIEKQLLPHAHTATAIIVEPILQGAGGMRIYSQDFLSRLKRWANDNHIYFIADEIMTGLGRTGLPLACQHADVLPDFLCLSKGLTSGWLPLSAVCTSSEIYHLFYDDYATGKAFMHSHTYCGNALAASVAIEVLNILEEENLYEHVQRMECHLAQLMQEIQEKTGKIQNIRYIGAMVAADLIVNDPGERRGYKVFQQAVKLGALLRPLGNTIYWLPPLTIENETLYELQRITLQVLRNV